MVRFGHSLDGPAGSMPTPGWAGVGTLTLRDFSVDPAHRRPLLLDQHLLILITVGHGTQEVDFTPYPCRPGSLIWARPGQVIRPGGQAGLDAIMVCWDPETLAGLVAGPAAQPSGPGYWQLAGEDEDAVINEVSQLVVDCQRHRRGTLAADLLRHQLAVLLLRLALLPPGNPKPPPGNPHPPPGNPRPPGGNLHPPSDGLHPSSDSLPPPGDNGSRPAVPAREDAGSDGSASTFRRLRDEVERSYGQTRRVEDYAGRLDCSVRTLTRACLAATGRSAKQVIDGRVALQAMRLLAATDISIAEIGRRLGFTEPTNFGRFFQREVGHSPGAFRAGLVTVARFDPVDGAGRDGSVPAARPGADRPVQTGP